MVEVSQPIPLMARRPGPSVAWFAWMLIAPAVAVIVAWPLLETVRLSYTDAGMNSEHWDGLDNDNKLLSSPKFLKIVGRACF